MLSDFKNIYTPQGTLKDVMKRPKLDLMMNLFRIPRAYAVSGFGDWNVGQHSVCAAFVALEWAKIRKFDAAKRDQFVVLALLHDLHEAVTGDILPFFKTRETKTAISGIQAALLKALKVDPAHELQADLKIVDMAAFLYEIKQSQAATLQPEKAKWLKRIYARQRRELLAAAVTHRVDQSRALRLLQSLDL